MRWSLVLFTFVWSQLVYAQVERGTAATTVQLPTFGVSIDADGELTVKSFPDPTGRLKAERIAAARSRLSKGIAARSDLRKVSLAELERALADCLDSGKPIDDAIQHLAGLQRIQYVFYYPAAKDVIIAGPAEGWFADPAGRVVGIHSGRPTLRLDDLAVALRVYAARGPARPFLGCTIDPPADGLDRLRQFQKKMPNVVASNQRAAVAQVSVQGTRDALGMADVHLFGIAPTTHFARVLVEADYRMKCIAIGLEPPPVAMKTYLGSLRGASLNTLQRWWFTPNYDCMRVSDDGLAMELVGQGVQLQTEDRVIESGGKLAAVAAKPSPAAAAFAKSFTEQYLEIAAASPVYAELRNLIDIAICAAWLDRASRTAAGSWKPDLLCDDKRYPIETFASPKKVACVANAIWNGNRLLVPAGGGVSIQPDEALKPENLLPADPGLSQKRAAMESARPAARWWWD